MDRSSPSQPGKKPVDPGLAGASHGLNVSHAREFNDALLAFLKA